MKEPQQLWQLDKLAQRYHCRPSDLLALDNRYSAWCLDQAVLIFCAGVEKRLDDVPTPKGKKGHERRQQNQQLLLNEILGIKEEEVKQTKKFRDPGVLFKRS